MTCCIGKARIYFREPINYWLTYQLPNGSFGSVTAPEPLTSECIEDTSSGTVGVVVMATRYSNYGGNPSEIGLFSPGNFTAPVSLDIVIDGNFALACVIGIDRTACFVYQPYYSSEEVGYYGYGYYIRDHWLDISPISGNLKTFKVIGTETETVYAEIEGLEECPTVISNICLMGEERYIDVEMGQGLPLLPAFIPDCLIAVTGFPLPENQIQIRKITTKPLATNPFKPVKLPQLVLTLNGLPGCPAEYRIECNPKDECPPDTDCSLDCNGLICCYKDGRVIKSFRK